MKNSNKVTAFATIIGAIVAGGISIATKIASNKEHAEAEAEQEIEYAETNSEPEEIIEESEVQDEPEPTYTADVEDAE